MYIYINNYIYIYICIECQRRACSSHHRCRFMKDLILRTGLLSHRWSAHWHMWPLKSKWHISLQSSPVVGRSFFGTWRENGWFKMSRKYTGHKGQASSSDLIKFDAIRKISKESKRYVLVIKNMKTTCMCGKQAKLCKVWIRLLESS